MRKKYHVYLTYDERRILINSLIYKKNELIATGHYTDAVDEVIEKEITSSMKENQDWVYQEDNDLWSRLFNW